MCGIIGQLNFKNQKINKFIFKEMINLLKHRGPDDAGYYFDNQVALGSVRLSIFDASNKGHMPMKSTNGRFVISYNGEVYNWREIRKKLKFNKWKSQTDTETILYSYIEQGPECLKLFKGMFSIAIWDNEKKEFFLARDREGIKPLYYYKSDQKFIFSSEVKGIIRSGVNKNINFSELHNFFKWGLIDHSAQTLYKNVYQLEPGCYIKASSLSNFSITRYYSLKEEVRECKKINKLDTSDRYFSKLEKIIKLYTRADVKYAAMLSGGTDSTILTNLIFNKLDRNINTFTYDFKGKSINKFGESKLSKIFTKKLGIKNHISYLKSKEVPDLFDKLMFYEELPITSLRVISEYKLSSLAKSLGFSVLISGDGGDQIGGGFKYYWYSIVLDEIKNKGIKAGKILEDKFLKFFNIKDKNRFILQSAMATLNPGTSTTDGVPYFNESQFNTDFLNKYGSSKYIFEKPFRSNLLNFQYIDFKYHNLPRVLRMKDRASMANGVEMRVPLLDSEMVKFAFNTDHNQRVKNTQQRYFMVKAANKHLKKNITPKNKISIVDPQREWLKNDLKDWAGDALNLGSLKEIGIFDIKYIKKNFDDYCKNKKNLTSYNLFQIINVAYWHESIFKKNVF